MSEPMGCQEGKTKFLILTVGFHALLYAYRRGETENKKTGISVTIKEFER